MMMALLRKLFRCWTRSRHHPSPTLQNFPFPKTSRKPPRRLSPPSMSSPPKCAARATPVRIAPTFVPIPFAWTARPKRRHNRSYLPPPVATTMRLPLTLPVRSADTTTPPQPGSFAAPTSTTPRPSSNVIPAARTACSAVPVASPTALRT